MSLAVTVLCLLVVFGGLHYLLGVRHRRKGEPPLVHSWIPFFGRVVEYSKCPPKFLLRLQKKHGDVFTVLIHGKYFTFLMDPHMFPSIIRHGKQLNFHEFSSKFSCINFDHPHVDDPLLGVCNDDLLRQYTFLQGAELTNMTKVVMAKLQQVVFHELNEAAVVGRTGGDVHGWRTDSLFSFCQRLIFEVTFVMLYGTSGDAEADRRLCKRLQAHFEPFDKVLPLISAGVPLWLLGSAKHHRDELKRELTHEKLSRRHNVSIIVQSRMSVWDANKNMQDTHKAGHHLAFLWGSVANTVPAIFWSLYHLLQCPLAQRALRDEVDATLGKSGAPLQLGSPLCRSREDLNAMLMLGSAVNESLRLTSAPMNIRVAMEDVAITMDSGFTLKLRKGDKISFSLQTLHTDPDIYEQPEAYKFDRFVQDGKEKTTFYKNGRRLQQYLMPFGSGNSICPGRFLALTEVKDFIFHLLALLDLELLPGQPDVGMDMSRVGMGLLTPKRDVLFRYRLRSHVGSAAA